MCHCAVETGQSAFFGGIMFSGKPLDYQDEPLTNNGFWPDLNLKDFQAQRSLPADIDADTISQALLAAVAEVNAELENVEASWKAKGHMLAADVPGVKMGGLNSLCAQYMKAVFARAKADLLGSSPLSGDVKPIQGRRVWKPAPGYWLRLQWLSAV